MHRASGCFIWSFSNVLADLTSTRETSKLFVRNLDQEVLPTTGCPREDRRGAALCYASSEYFIVHPDHSRTFRPRSSPSFFFHKRTSGPVTSETLHRAKPATFDYRLPCFQSFLQLCVISVSSSNSCCLKTRVLTS